MKRIGYLYSEISSIENIKKSIYKSSLGKKKRSEVKKVLNNIKYYSNQIKIMLENESYIPSEYKICTIYDFLNKKERVISKPKYYPDQIIQYCLMSVLEPILIKKMYLYSCGSIPKRGTSFGHKNIRKWLDNDLFNTKYCLKLDIRKFYPSINKIILKDKFEKIIKDKQTLNLINLIIDSDCKGIPLGNYTSGYFSNFYLNDLDFFIKKDLKVKHYIRYVDDLVLFSSNKRKLKKILSEINIFLLKEKLIVKNNYQIFSTYEKDIDFLGYRFYKNKTILRKRNMIRISRKAKKISKSDVISLNSACSLMSYYGWIKHSNSYNFYLKEIKPYVKISLMKKIISENSKINC